VECLTSLHILQENDIQVIAATKNWMLNLIIEYGNRSLWMVERTKEVK